MTIASGQQILAADILKHATADGYLSLTSSTVLTIASGAVTATANFYRVDTESAAASDDLDTITAGTGVDDGHLLVLRASNDARTVVIKHNTGNIFCENGIDQTLNDAGDIAILFYDSNLTKWMAAGLVGPSSVNTNELADSGVTAVKLASDAVTTVKILDANVTRAKLSNGTALSVVGRSANSSGVPADIAATAATGAVLRESGSVLGFGTIVAAGIASDAVTTAKILDSNVTAAKLATDAVTTVKITDANVTLAKMASDSVDDTKAGDRVPQFYRRQGGSATDWSVTGTTTRTPTSVRMQAGVGTSDGVGDLTITFPTAFSDVPIVLCSSRTAGVTVATGNATASNVALKASSGSGVIAWLAIGPE